MGHELFKAATNCSWLVSTIFLHPGKFSIICSCAKSPRWVKPGVPKPEELVAQDICQHPCCSICSPWHQPLFAFPAGWVAEEPLKCSLAAGERGSSSLGQPGMLSACCPVLGLALPPDGRRSGEQHGSVMLASPPAWL